MPLSSLSHTLKRVGRRRGAQQLDLRRGVHHQFEAGGSGGLELLAIEYPFEEHRTLAESRHCAARGPHPPAQPPMNPPTPVHARP